MISSDTMPNSVQPLEVLLVEDDDDDARLTEKAFESDAQFHNFHRAEDGVQALGFLRREDAFANAPRPDLILLDLNMPRKSGREVLKEIKEDPELLRIPIVVLTTSDDERDIAFSYDQQANSYVTKPVDLHALREVLKAVMDYWFSVVRLPPAS